MSDRSRYAITTFYKFVRLDADGIERIRFELLQRAQALSIEGLFLLGKEGCNATIAGLPEDLKEFKVTLNAIPEFKDIEYKDSTAEKRPFRRFKLDLRDEIVTIKKDIFPDRPSNNHLSPKEWHEALKEKDGVVIDTRNFYETELGKFQGARTLDLERFSDFPEKVEELSIPRNKKVLMYCTGGIRCEKAIIAMQKAGYEQVYQLQGGILKYLEEFPSGYYEGECFVFDHRVAVDNKLRPSQRFSFCPHCGNPAELTISCLNCDKTCMVCHRCTQQLNRNSCSKNCAHHVLRKRTADCNPKEPGTYTAMIGSSDGASEK